MSMRSEITGAFVAIFDHALTQERRALSDRGGFLVEKGHHAGRGADAPLRRSGKTATSKPWLGSWSSPRNCSICQ